MLPLDATLKDINRQKKELNWGELPPFYHMVSNSLAEIDGIDSHGFDNALKRIINQNNWNQDLLKGEKPRIAMYRLYTTRGFEVHCFPMAQNKEVDQFVVDHPMMEFKRWEPGTMRTLMQIARFQEFAAYAFVRGDDADRSLALYAQRISEKVIQDLKDHVNVVKDEGQTIGELILKYHKGAKDIDLTQDLRQNPWSGN